MKYKDFLNIERKNNHVIVYDNYITDWKEIFKIHPIKNNLNKELFYMIENSKRYIEIYSKENEKIELNDLYTWNLLRKIAQNSYEDCVTFYEIGKKILKNKNEDKNEYVDKWFKKALTSIYLSKKQIPESLNYLNDLNNEDREEVLMTSFQYFGENSIDMYKKLENYFNISYFNEKLILNYWKINNNSHNFIDRVIDNLNPNRNFDLNYLTTNIEKKFLLKYQTFKINNHFINFKDIFVNANQYFDKKYQNIENKNKIVPLSEMLSINVILFLIKNNEEFNNIKNKDMFVMNNIENKNKKYNFCDHKFYKNIEDIFNNWCFPTWSKEIILEYIEENKNKDKENYLKIYWEKIEKKVQTLILNQELNNIVLKEKNKIKI